MSNNTLLWLLVGVAALLTLGAGGYAVVISERGKQYLPQIHAAASKWGVPWTLLYAQLQQESNFDPNAVSSAGAQGIAQFEPQTAAAYGLTDPFDANASIDAEGHLMHDLYNTFGDWGTALAAYNWGAGAVQDAINNYGTGWLSYAPSETQNYVSTIIGNSGVQSAIA